jgi:murein DD-endopeptidase MepM/ murein hydrolase activator NlpD
MAIQPIKNGRITSGYGPRQSPFNPTRTEFHPGLDIAPTTDGNVYVAKDGKVVWVDKTHPVYNPTTGQGSFGNVVYIQLKDGYYSIYPHMAHINDDIVVNLQVKEGDILGTVGNTGLSAGIHCHYEERLSLTPGRSRDPKDITSLYV